MGNLFTSFIDDYIGKKINLEKIIDNKEQNIGLNAIINENGFQKDGSHYEGNLIVNPQSGEDFNFKDTFQRIADGNKRFEYFERADTNHIKVIDEFLGTCQEKNNLTRVQCHGTCDSAVPVYLSSEFGFQKEYLAFNVMQLKSL